MHAKKQTKGCIHRKNFISQFKAFALRGNVMDMAVGVLIGGAFSGIVTSLTDNFINPILQFLTGALILFCLMRAMGRLMAIGRKKEEEAAPTTKPCPFCCTEIPLAAVRCPHCTSTLDEPAQGIQA